MRSECAWGRRIRGLAGAAAIGAFAHLAQAAETCEKRDANGDGQTDEWTYMDNGKKVRMERDRDGDSRVDRWDYYDASAGHFRQARDSNKDGRPDDWRYFEQGRMLILREKDTNFDGKVDERKLTEWALHRATNTYQYLYVWKEVDKDFDGVIDQYRVRGQKHPDPDKTGMPMNGAPKLRAPEDPQVRHSEKSEVERRVENREAWEQVLNDSWESAGER
ncbi:MAG: hypothetical protein HQL11_04125 [Candidatus Omnitrophica bacterium]|nr:hypothetical protein [Candidatus Omnitrophota bacterium]